MQVVGHVHDEDEAVDLRARTRVVYQYADEVARLDCRDRVRHRRVRLLHGEVHDVDIAGLGVGVDAILH